MCFSFKISIGTFLFSWSISIYLLQKKLTKIWKEYIYSLLIFSSILNLCKEFKQIDKLPPSLISHF